MYGRDAQIKEEQDLAFDIGLAVDRSRDEAEIRTKKHEEETAAMAKIIAHSKSTARQDKIRHWKSMLDLEPEMSCEDMCTTIDVRFPDGQRRRRRFLASAQTTQLVAFVGASGLVPCEIFDTDQWGIFTTHPRVLLHGQLALRTLTENQLFPRAIVHVGELPLVGSEENGADGENLHGTGTGLSINDAMELD
eukprot:g3280.t1